MDIPVEGGTYTGEESGVKVTVTTEDGTFANPVKLNVAAIAEDDEEYARAEAELANGGYEYDGMIAFDIHFTDLETNEEVEPAKPVSLTIEVTDYEKAGIPTGLFDPLTVVHIFDEGGTELVSAPKEIDNPIDGGGDIIVDGAETEVFSTYTISWGNRSYDIHYVDTNGNSLTPTSTPEFSNGYKFLIYDVEGYEYDSTHYGSRTGTSIKPLLANYGNDRVYLDSNNYWQYLRNDIYVVYKKKTEPSTGGTPTVKDETWPENNDAPQFSKTSVGNGDGTNTISLSITAAEKPVEKSTPADVIVVFDVSGSMSSTMNGQTRLDRAKNAVNTMANTLLNGNNKNIRMALISYSTTATEVQGFTNNYSTFSGKVNNLEADGGTNWEQGLQLANQMKVRGDAATFIVFITDGDPTFRVSRGNVSDADLDLYSDGTYQYYRNNYLFGEGYDDSDGRNFDFAVKQVEAINSSNKTFYAIGVSSDVTKVQNLTTQGGVAADHAFVATDSAAMTNAFKSITESIKSTLGFGAVEMTDGITELTNAEMKVMESVDPKSFKYYRWGGEGNKYGPDEQHMTEWTTREDDGCAAASYSETDGAVHWNMGEGFQLEDGVHYVVTFRVWASQEAYDLVADLNNGIKSYDSLDDDEKLQIVKLDTDPVTYALKTNTENVKATYKKTSETGGTVTISEDTPIEANYNPGTQQNLALESMKLTIKKEFEDNLTGGEDRETSVTLVLKRRNAHQNPEEAFADYPVPQGSTSSANIVLNEDNNWTYELYVAPGVEVNGEVLEHGYDFTITEPDIDYHYGLIEEIINPMIVDGKDKYYGDGYLLDDDETVHDYIDQSLTAVNRVKSGIDIKKVLLDKDGTQIENDQEFIITGKILNEEGQPYLWNQGDDVNNSGAYHKFIPAPEGTTETIYTFDGRDYIRTVYKGHFASTADISFKLKPGEFVRFINVPDGSTFEFTEYVPENANFEISEVEALTQHKESDEENAQFVTDGDIQPVVEDNVAKLTTGVVGNKQYSVTFTNKLSDKQFFFVYHSSNHKIEKVYFSDSRVKPEYNEQSNNYVYTYDLVKDTLSEHHYGGYYKAYGGTSSTKDDILGFEYVKDTTGVETAYDEIHADGEWATDPNGNNYDASAIRCSATNVYFWKKADAYKSLNNEDPGDAIHPVANEVYYLKEVPEKYLQNHGRWVYDWAKNNEIVSIYMLTVVDDQYYSQVGFDMNSGDYHTARIVTQFSYQHRGSDTVTKVTSQDLISARGYLGVYNATELKNYISSETGLKVQPYWITLDGVRIETKGHTLTKKTGTGDTLTKDNIVVTPNP